MVSLKKNPSHCFPPSRDSIYTKIKYPYQRIHLIFCSISQWPTVYFLEFFQGSRWTSPFEPCFLSLSPNDLKFLFFYMLPRMEYLYIWPPYKSFFLICSWYGYGPSHRPLFHVISLNYFQVLVSYMFPIFWFLVMSYIDVKDLVLFYISQNLCWSHMSIYFYSLSSLPTLCLYQNFNPFIHGNQDSSMRYP